ncbi:MAG: hypothetical protein V2B19_04900 [Pseudomonadota bacterium]
MYNNRGTMKTTFMPFLLAALWAMLAPSNGFGAAHAIHVTFNEDGLVSIDAHSQRLDELLEEIADVLKLRIYLYEVSESEKVTVSVHDYEPDEALRAILRNRNYCVVFGRNEDLERIRRIDGLNAKQTSGNAGKQTSGNTGNRNAGEEETDDPRVVLESQIKDIRDQIESGEADRQYEQWSSIRGEKYVTRPEENLAQLEKQLEELSQQY